MKPLRVTGDSKQGYRIAIPAIVQRAPAYKFEAIISKGTTIVTVEDGTLIYTPVRL
jgi:hypothetical protein